MLPSRVFVLWLLVPTFLSLFTLWNPQSVRFVLGLDAALAFVALLDWIFCRPLDIDLHVTSRHIMSIGQPNRITLELRYDGKRTLNARLKPDLPPGFVVSEAPESGVLELCLESRRRTDVRYHLVPQQRGRFNLGDHHLRFGSPLGLWIREQRLSTARQVSVYPDLALIRTYEQLAREHRQDSLVRTTRKRGGESEFARLRDYVADDNYRFIDWKATARQNKLICREYQLESDQNVFFMLDAGRLMTALAGELTQFDHALNSALLLAHIAARGGDRVGLLCFDETIRSFVRPHNGPKAAAHLVRATYDLHPRLTESSYQRALSIFHAQIKQRSLLILFTQLLDDTAVDELSGQLRLLCKRHLPLVILQRDEDLTCLAQGRLRRGSHGDLYERGTAAELLLWKERAIDHLKGTGAHVIETTARGLNNRLINRYLEIKAHFAL